jgi:ABC-2 type transport system permease protein
MLSYLLAAFVSPGLITSDLANGALPLYFSRPFSRTQYLAGKAALMLGVLSLLTWIPGLVLFVIESTLSGWAWMQANLWMAAGLAAGLFVWIVMATLIGFALSALVKWRVAAGALVVGVLFAGAGFGAAINAVVRTSAGSAVDLSFVMRAVWSDLLRYDAGIYLPLGQAWLVLGAVAVVCVGILLRRIRPFEVIK